MKQFEYKFFEKNEWVYWWLINAVDIDEASEKIYNKYWKYADSLY